MNKKNKLTNKINNLELVYRIEESNIYLNYLCNRIRFYENEIKELNNNNFSKFRNKKIQEYNNRFEEYNDKLFESYIKIEEEFDLIEKLNNSIQ